MQEHSIEYPEYSTINFRMPFGNTVAYQFNTMYVASELQFLAVSFSFLYCMERHVCDTPNKLFLMLYKALENIF